MSTILSRVLNNPEKGYELKQHENRITWEVEGKIVISVPVFDRTVEEPENTITATLEHIASTIVSRFAEANKTSPETSGE